MKMHNFNIVPDIKRKRVKMRLPYDIKTTMSVGKLYPIEFMEILPGDTISGKVVNVSRVSSAFLRPVMDNLFCDIHHFFVPLRLTCSNLEGVFGDSSPNAYLSNTLATIPNWYTSNQTVTEKTVADYLGLDLGTYAMTGMTNTMSILPFRAFALIWNYWFRNENIDSPVNVYQTMTPNSNEKIDTTAWGGNHYTGQLPPVNKIKDIFTSCLPAPQKGPGSAVPFYVNDLPVITKATSAYTTYGSGATTTQLKMANRTTPQVAVTGTTDYGLALNGTGVNTMTATATAGDYVVPWNLYAVNPITGAVGQMNVNDMRFAFAYQKILELDARAGSRYSEYLLSHYGVQNPDSRLQMPEYLGGGRIPISVQQVAQTTPLRNTSDPTQYDSTVGDLGAFSLSNGYSKFSKSFTEHGYLFTVACIRQVHSYSQGIEKKWFRLSRNDFFDPLYAHLGEQPVYQEQLYHQANGGGSNFKTVVFGYNEYGAEYRYIPNTCNRKKITMFRKRF